MGKKTAYCFDLDGTLTKEEILPLLSREVGLYEEIQALTVATLEGIIPFRKSFLLRCKLLGEIPVSTVQSIISNVKLHSEVVNFIKKNSQDCYVITGNLDVWIKPIFDKIPCKFITSIAEVNNDKLGNVTKVLDKGDAIDEIRALGIYDTIVTVGDSMGDVNMFEKGDIGVAFGGVHDPIKTLVELSDMVTFGEKGLCNILNTL